VVPIKLKLIILHLKIKEREKSGCKWGLTSSHENSDSAVNQNALFHGESLFVITSSDSESVTLEF
jgi:hypothetical protein